MPRQYFYGVYDEHKKRNKVFTNWDDAKEHMLIIKNQMGFCKVKKFTNRQDAEYFADNGIAPLTSFSLPREPNTLYIYTDGSAGTDNNGIKRGGLGIYFGPGNLHNCGLPFIDNNPTNNRAELMAIKKALEIARPMDTYDKVVIYSDNKYSRDCLCAWRTQWTQNNFRNNTIQNRDIIEDAWELLDRYPRNVEIIWLKGHAGNRGNEAADLLARKGAGL